MSELIILRKIKLPKLNFLKAKSKHIVNSEEMKQPSELQIAKYEDDEGYYLLYVDKLGNEMNDTFHESMQDALEQAEWEFGIKKADWEVIN